MKRKSKLLGFTLVEAIMSVAILSMVLAMVYGVFFSMLRGTEAGAETALQVQRNRVALKTLEDAFSGLVYYEPDKDNPNTGVYAFIVDTLDFDYPSVSFVSRVPPDFLGSKEFGSQTLRRITFQIEDDDDFGRSLVMYQSATLQPEYDLEVEEPSRWVLGKDLDQFLMLFYSTSVEEWINEWDDTNSVPSRIKFELAYARPDGGAAQIEDMHKREFSLFSRNITKEMRLQQLKPAPKKTSTRGPSRGSSRGPSRSTSGRKAPTSEQIAAWRKKREEDARKRQRENDGKRKLPEGSRRVSDYGRLENTAKRYDANGDGILDPGERAKWRADYAASRNSQSSGGAKGAGTGTGGGTGGGDTGGGDTGGGGGSRGGGGGASVLPEALVLNEELARINAGTLQDLVDAGLYDSMEDLQSTAPSGSVWGIDPDTGFVVPIYP